MATLLARVRPGLRRRAVAALALALTATLAGSVAAHGGFNVLRSNPGNSFAAATLGAPGTPGSIHPNVSGAGTGNVTLTWSPSATSWTQSYQVYRAAATTGTPTWSSVGSVLASSCSTTCTYTDLAAVYNQQYLYQVQSVYNSWTTSGGTDMALSLAPTTGSGSTDATRTATSVQEPALATNGQPTQMAAGAGTDSNVYFVQQNGTQIGRLSTTNPNAVGVELALAQGWTVSGLTTFNNLVYVAENAANGSKVVELTPSGTVSHEWTISSSNIGLGPIVVGSSQFLYYAEFSGGALTLGQLTL